MNIQEILNYIGEDKHTNPTTTSNKFKQDLYNFCIENNIKYVVELGTHKGQTSRVLSYCCTEVHTINVTEDSLVTAKLLNADRTNITYYAYNLYDIEENKQRLPIGIDYSKIDLILIDAGHGYKNVIDDVYRTKDLDKEIYYCFDDYGLIPDVHNAVNDLISIHYMELVANVGHEQGYDFKNGRTLKLGFEGIICKKL